MIQLLCIVLVKKVYSVKARGYVLLTVI